MPIKFDFLSPGVELREIDQSQLPENLTGEGMMISGTAPMGPTLRPIRVNSLENFVQIFGAPISGKGNAKDVWRNGYLTSPTYGMYAAQAWLASETSPVTFVRLAGEEIAGQSSGIRAGWSLTNGIKTLKADVADAGGAYGLFIVNSASTDTPVTGTLAAMFYSDQGFMRLSGSARDGNPKAMAGLAIQSLTANQGTGKACEFKLEHITATNATSSFVFHFDNSAGDNTQGYIRNVFNTNPQKMNGDITAAGAVEKMFLGETFEEAVSRHISGTAGQQFALLMRRGQTPSTKIDFGKHHRPATAAKSGWFFAQDPNSNNPAMTGSFEVQNQEKLFRLVAHSEGEHLQKYYQVGIEISRLGSSVDPYSTFHLYIMDLKGNKVEQFKNLNFNPGSSNYIAKKIGDQFQVWNETERKYDIRGEYVNVSDYVYVELSDAVRDGSLQNMSAVPFGVQGPIIYDDLVFEIDRAKIKSASGDHDLDDTIAGSDGELAHGHDSSKAGSFVDAGVSNGTEYRIVMPTLKLTTEKSKGSNKTNYAYSDFLGVSHSKAGSNALDKSYCELVRAGAYHAGGGIKHDVNASSDGAAPTGDKKFSYVFSLDDVIWERGQGQVYYERDSRKKAGTHNPGTLDKSITAVSGTTFLVNDLRVRKFQSPFFGGSEGVNIKESNPFANRVLNNSSNNQESDNYAVYSIMKSLRTIEDAEVVRYDLLSVPGTTRELVTDKVLQVCSDRGDSLGIIDATKGFEPAGSEKVTNQTGSIQATISSLQGRQLNTSYGATYYPWIRLRDTTNGNNDVIMAPPSVAAIGAIARSEAVSEPWFAPAGFNRGGISVLGGVQGPRVVGTWEHLTKENRDDLYENNVNPIARFPAINEIVIFGQKTLQQTPSALDRINVRRLMIFLKKTIGRIADTILFDQNVQATWLRFRTQAETVLNQVQSRLGITEFKLVLDTTTTTPDLIDQNILYAKIYVKPARAIEYIVVDFIITRTGVEF